MDAISVPAVKKDVGEATVEVCGEAIVKEDVVPDKKNVEVSSAGSIGQNVVLPTVEEGSFSFPDDRKSGASGSEKVGGCHLGAEMGGCGKFQWGCSHLGAEMGGYGKYQPRPNHAGSALISRP
ncbi:hypothetical protein ACOSQ2_003848 [Xanthoceras sorbifolium]